MDDRTCDPISFEDPELELAVREAVAKTTGPLGSSDVAELTSLVTPSITSLKGVECLLGLTSLDFGSLPPSRVTDLSPLRGLKSLSELSLNRNPIASLEPLGKLPNLEQLFMNRLPVTIDLSPLAGAPRLINLSMLGDTIESLGPLGAVSTLRSLNINGATLLHPEGVAAVTSLEELLATGVFDDAAPLASLTHLKKLRIAQKPLNHFAALESLVDLRLLDVANTGVSDISAVTSMHELVDFFAAANGIKDVGPLAGLEQLQQVTLIENQLTDVTPLAQNPGLGDADFLYLKGNALSCTDQKANLDALRGRGAEVDSDCP
jgi:internalin A